MREAFQSTQACMVSADYGVQRSITSNYPAASGITIFESSRLPHSPQDDT